MEQDLWMLAGTAGALGVIHTVLGPDHYVPFVMMRRAQKWSALKMAAVTGICGVGHVFGSFALGAIGIALGIGFAQLELVESVRGSLSAWLLLGFGLAYLAWGLRQAWKNRPHRHWHVHGDGVVHNHEHTHHGAHAHVHQGAATSITPWFLFVIFILGPCEALIPVLMYPAYELSLAGVALVTGVFSVATVSTMLFMVVALDLGFDRLKLGRYERYGHALAGAAIALCGGAIAFLPL